MLRSLPDDLDGRKAEALDHLARACRVISEVQGERISRASRKP